MLLFSLFLAGFMLGVFMTLKVFSPEKQEESWDPQLFPASSVSLSKNEQAEPIAAPILPTPTFVHPFPRVS